MNATPLLSGNKTERFIYGPYIKLNMVVAAYPDLTVDQVVDAIMDNLNGGLKRQFENMLDWADRQMKLQVEAYLGRVLEYQRLNKISYLAERVKGVLDEAVNL